MDQYALAFFFNRSQAFRKLKALVEARRSTQIKELHLANSKAMRSRRKVFSFLRLNFELDQAYCSLQASIREIFSKKLAKQAILGLKVSCRDRKAKKRIALVAYSCLSRNRKEQIFKAWRRETLDSRIQEKKKEKLIEAIIWIKKKKVLDQIIQVSRQNSMMKFLRRKVETKSQIDHLQKWKSALAQRLATENSLALKVKLIRKRLCFNFLRSSLGTLNHAKCVLFHAVCIKYISIWRESLSQAVKGRTEKLEVAKKKLLGKTICKLRKNLEIAYENRYSALTKLKKYSCLRAYRGFFASTKYSLRINKIRRSVLNSKAQSSVKKTLDHWRKFLELKKKGDKIINASEKSFLDKFFEKWSFYCALRVPGSSFALKVKKYTNFKLLHASLKRIYFNRILLNLKLTKQEVNRNKSFLHALHRLEYSLAWRKINLKACSTAYFLPGLTLIQKIELKLATRYFLVCRKVHIRSFFNALKSSSDCWKNLSSKIKIRERRRSFTSLRDSLKSLVARNQNLLEEFKKRSVKTTLRACWQKLGDFRVFQHKLGQSLLLQNKKYRILLVEVIRSLANNSRNLQRKDSLGENLLCRKRRVCISAMFYILKIRAITQLRRKEIGGKVENSKSKSLLQRKFNTLTQKTVHKPNSISGKFISVKLKQQFLLMRCCLKLWKRSAIYLGVMNAHKVTILVSLTHVIRLKLVKNAFGQISNYINYLDNYEFALESLKDTLNRQKRRVSFQSLKQVQPKIPPDYSQVLLNLNSFVVAKNRDLLKETLSFFCYFACKAKKLELSYLLVNFSTLVRKCRLLKAQRARYFKAFKKILNSTGKADIRGSFVVLKDFYVESRRSESTQFLCESLSGVLFRQLNCCFIVFRQALYLARLHFLFKRKQGKFLLSVFQAVASQGRRNHLCITLKNVFSRKETFGYINFVQAVFRRKERMDQISTLVSLLSKLVDRSNCRMTCIGLKEILSFVRSQALEILLAGRKRRVASGIFRKMIRIQKARTLSRLIEPYRFSRLRNFLSSWSSALAVKKCIQERELKSKYFNRWKVIAHEAALLKRFMDEKSSEEDENVSIFTYNQRDRLLSIIAPNFTSFSRVSGMWSQREGEEDLCETSPRRILDSSRLFTLPE